MRLANIVGITTFVTGGIGGVHRQFKDNNTNNKMNNNTNNNDTIMDVSADLLELQTTPVIVVSAGIKSILDIRNTLEKLESYSVPTIAYQTNEYPAFFSPKSNIFVDDNTNNLFQRVDTPQDIANIYITSRQLNLTQG